MLVAGSAGARERGDFHFRARLGLGLGRAEVTGEYSTTATADFGFAVGPALSERVVLYGEFFGIAAVISEADVEDSLVEIDQGVVRTLGLGIGLTYYTDSDCYFSGTLGVTQAELDFNPYDSDTTEAETGFGLGGSLAAGREFALGPNLGFGLEARAVFSVNDKGDELEESVTVYGLTLGGQITFH